VLRLRPFSAWQIGEQGVLVTLLARHMGPEFPDIARLADLKPMLAALENPGRDLVAAAIAEMRRQHIERKRNQAGHGS